jgi:hypothetical protein
MKKFLRNNWQALVFPLLILSCIFFDQVVWRLPLVVTLFKLTLLGVAHYVYVLKTMYLYNSDIYRYLGNIKAEREKNYTMDSLFSPLVSKAQYRYFNINCSFTDFWKYFPFCGLARNSLGCDGNFIYYSYRGIYCRNNSALY